MQTDTLIRGQQVQQVQIEERLFQSVMLGADTEEALAETAGLLAEAEAAFVRLSHPRFSLPPPVRTR